LFLSECWDVHPHKRPTFQEIVPRLKGLTISTILLSDGPLRFWQSSFGDVIRFVFHAHSKFGFFFKANIFCRVSFGNFLSALSKSSLVPPSVFFNKRDKLALRRFLHVESDSSAVTLDVFGRFSRAFLTHPPLTPSLLTSLYQSRIFDPFATLEDVYSHLEVCFEAFKASLSYVRFLGRGSWDLYFDLFNIGSHLHLCQRLLLHDGRRW
jgi:hypothetical protein